MKTEEQKKIRMLQVNRGIYFSNDPFIEGYNRHNIDVVLFAVAGSLDMKQRPGLEIHQIFCPCIPKPKIKGLRYIVNLINFIFAIITLLFNSARYLLKNKREIDIIYGNKPEGIIVGSILAKIFKKPSIARYYGTMINPYLKKSVFHKLRYNFAEYFSFQCKTDLIIITKDGSCGELCAEHFKNCSDSYRVYYNGLKSIPEIPKVKTASTITVLSLGRLHTWKRVDRLISAIPKILKSVNDIEFIIVGDGIEKANYEKQVKKLALEEYVTFTGHVPHEQVKEIMQKADIFCSLQDYCNFSKNIIEALSNSLCSIVTDTGSIRNILTDNVNVLIIPVKGVDDRLSELLIQLAGDSDRRRELGKNARQFIVDNIWSMEERIQAEVNEIKILVGKYHTRFR